MEDLTSWVTKEAQNMGLDFACLSQQTKNNIISILMSGLENGFRSRMDSPDIRFAKRRGIGKGNQIQANLASPANANNPNTNLSTDSSCAMPNNDDQISCPPMDLICPPPGDTTCDACGYIMSGCGDTIECPTDQTNCQDETSCPIDTNCMLMGPCYTDTNSCEENDGWTCDNVCSNQQNQLCRDRDNTPPNCIDNKCRDNSCSNNAGHDCSDQSTGGCQDNTCTNNNNCGDGSLSLGCTDSTCVNNHGCADSAIGQSKCSDGGCKNTQSGNQCTDTGSCQDDGCINSQSCSDTGSSTTVFCSDDSCTNSKSPQATKGCVDEFFCSDIGCANYSKNIAQCTDSMVGAGQLCTDNPCSNWGGEGSKCINDGLTCSDSSCTNNPYCDDNTTPPATCSPFHTDYGTSSCRDGCNDNVESNCNDSESHCSNSGHNCIDMNCTDDDGCQNKSNCVDYGTGYSACTDNKCRNEDPAVCSDRGTNCSDNQCTNTGLCTDDEGCSDTSCSNESVCQDFIPPGCNNSEGSDTGRCSTLTKNDTCGDALC